MKSSLDFYRSGLKIRIFKAIPALPEQYSIPVHKPILELQLSTAHKKTDEISKVISYYYLLSLDKWHDPV